MSIMLSGCTREEAIEITERFRDSAGRVETAWHVMVATAIEAYKGRVWIPLGYTSWNAYCAEEVNDSAARIPTELRIQMVGQMSEEGMSTRAISPVVGAGHKTVARDLESARVSNDTPVFDEPADVDREDEWTPGVAVNAVTGEVTEPGDPLPVVTETHTVKVVTGLDGKQYKVTPTLNLPPVPTVEKTVKQQNAEQAAKDFGTAIYALTRTTTPEGRDVILRAWALGAEECTPTTREHVTSGWFRTIARGLNALANEWESK